MAHRSTFINNFEGQIQIASDTNGLVLGAGQDSSIIDNGSAMVLDYDILNAGSRSLIVKENAVTKATFDTNGLDVVGKISSGTLEVTNGTYDALDVSGVNTVFVDTSGGDVIIGGTVGGVDGQILSIVVHDATNDTTMENVEGTGNQDFYLHVGADETLTAEYGGWVFVNHGGTHWHDASHAKHV